MQDDKLQPLITVEEAMTFVSNVKLEPTIPKTYKQSKVSMNSKCFRLMLSEMTYELAISQLWAYE